MANDPWTGARLGDMNDGPLGGLYLAEAVKELGKWSCPGFPTIAAREDAFAAWRAAGNADTDNMTCNVAGVLYTRKVGTWVPLTQARFAAGSSSIAVTTGQATLTKDLAYGVTFAATPLVFVCGADSSSEFQWAFFADLASATGFRCVLRWTYSGGAPNPGTVVFNWLAYSPLG